MFQPVSPFNVRSEIPMKARMTPMIVEKEGTFLKTNADKMGTIIAANPVINGILISLYIVAQMCGLHKRKKGKLPQ